MCVRHQQRAFALHAGSCVSLAPVSSPQITSNSKTIEFSLDWFFTDVEPQESVYDIAARDRVAAVLGGFNSTISHCLIALTVFKTTMTHSDVESPMTQWVTILSVSDNDEWETAMSKRGFSETLTPCVRLWTGA